MLLYTDPGIQQVSEKKLVGKRLSMSYADNHTPELWRSFMPRRNEIRHRSGTDHYSLQVYPPSFFEVFNPAAVFEKWALAEVTTFENIPLGMETFLLPAGLYAVFHYKGSAAGAPEFFRSIFTDWLPSSGYTLDDRPHFEILGDKYKKNDPESEEDVWIPISH